MFVNLIGRLNLGVLVWLNLKFKFEELNRKIKSERREQNKTTAWARIPKPAHTHLPLGPVLFWGADTWAPPISHYPLCADSFPVTALRALMATTPLPAAPALIHASALTGARAPPERSLIPCTDSSCAACTWDPIVSVVFYLVTDPA